MALVEGLICGIIAILYIESLRSCFTSRYNEIIPIIIHHPSSTTDLIISNTHPDFDIEQVAPLISEKINDTCSICLESMDTIRYCRKTKCGHIFCSDCIQEWFYKKKNCPLCNTQF